MMTTLQQLFERHGTDKASHFYASFYETLPAPKRMLEVGVYKGASLRAWSEWWPNAEKVGIDTFARGHMPANLPPRTLVRGCDSRTVTFANLGYRGFDLTIDDGSHRPIDQAKTFRNLWPLVAPGGVYVIEDVLPIDLIGEDNLPPWFAERKQHFNLATWLSLSIALTVPDGTIERHDFRQKSGKPDSYLVVIRKAS